MLSPIGAVLAQQPRCPLTPIPLCGLRDLRAMLSPIGPVSSPVGTRWVFFDSCSFCNSWLLAPGSWLLAPGSWLLAPGSWLLAPGSWLLAPGS
jgi:hypothetical protein